MIILSDKEADFIRSLIRSLKERTESTSEHDRCGVAIKTLNRKTQPSDVLLAWQAVSAKASAMANTAKSGNHVGTLKDAWEHYCTNMNDIEAEVEIRRTA